VSSDGYRSYVIRVRRRTGSAPDPDAGSTTRLDLEDLLEGSTASVSGAAARSLADSLEGLLDAKGRNGSVDSPAARPEGGLP